MEIVLFVNFVLTMHLTIWVNYEKPNINDEGLGSNRSGHAQFSDLADE